MIPVSLNCSWYRLKYNFMYHYLKFDKLLVLKNWIMKPIDYYAKKTDPPICLDFSYQTCLIIVCQKLHFSLPFTFILLLDSQFIAMQIYYLSSLEWESFKSF